MPIIQDTVASRRSSRSRKTHSLGPINLPTHPEIRLSLNVSQTQAYQALLVDNDPTEVKIWMRNSIIEHFPINFAIPAICGGDDYFRTAPTGYCSLLVLAQLSYLQHNPELRSSPPDCSSLSEDTLRFAREQLEPLRSLIESEDPPISTNTQNLWALFQDDTPQPLTDEASQEFWMYDADFITLAAQLKLSFSLWQEPYEGIDHDIPSGTAPLSYIFRQGKIRHHSSSSSPYLQLSSFPRSLSLGSLVIQSTSHYYIYTAVSPELLQIVQNELYSHLDNLTESSVERTGICFLFPNLPPCASTATFITVPRPQRELPRRPVYRRRTRSNYGHAAENMIE